MPFNANASSITLSGNVATGNLVNGFAVAGHIGGQVTWDGDDNFPFVVWDDVIVDTGAKLTLAAGAVLKFRDFYRTLWVDGALVAQGVAGTPVILTSLRDDTIGGDTNNDGTAPSCAQRLGRSALQQWQREQRARELRRALWRRRLSRERVGGYREHHAAEQHLRLLRRSRADHLRRLPGGQRQHFLEQQDRDLYRKQRAAQPARQPVSGEH